MSDPLDDLKQMLAMERGRVPGHWTVEHLERGVAEIERLRAEADTANSFAGNCERRAWAAEARCAELMGDPTGAARLRIMWRAAIASDESPLPYK